MNTCRSILAFTAIGASARQDCRRTILVAFSIVLASLLATPVAGQSRQVEDVEWNGSGKRPDNAPVEVYVRRGGSPIHVTKGGVSLNIGDSITVGNPWKVKLEVDRTARRNDSGNVTLSRDASSSSGFVFGSGPNSLEGLLELPRKNRLGGSLIVLRRGALALDNWQTTNDLLCVVSAVQACTVPKGTGFVLVVSDDDIAQLAVTSDTVEIRWWADSLMTASSTVPDSVVNAHEDDAYWWWTDSIPPTRGASPRRATTPPPRPASPEVRELVDQLTDDIWSDPIYKKWWFWVPPTAVAACLLFDIWICGGSDVSGNVILNPTP